MSAARLAWATTFAPGREQLVLAASRDVFLLAAFALFVAAWVTTSVALAVVAGSVLAVAVTITFAVRLLDWDRDSTQVGAR